MSTVNLNAAELVSATNGPFEEAHMAAAAFLARYSGRTLETYRFDLRSYFEWCAGVGLAVLEAKRPHIELYRTVTEQRASLRPPSIAGYPPSAASTGSLISTAASARTLPSTSAGRRSNPTHGEAWIVASWARS